MRVEPLIGPSASAVPSSQNLEPDGDPNCDNRSHIASMSAFDARFGHPGTPSKMSSGQTKKNAEKILQAQGSETQQLNSSSLD